MPGSMFNLDFKIEKQIIILQSRKLDAIWRWTNPSYVGIENTDQTVDHILCLCDSDPLRTGITLLQHYTQEQKIRELLALGNCEAIQQEIKDITVCNHSWTGRSITSVNKDHMLSNIPRSYAYIWNRGTQEWVVCEDGGQKPPNRQWRNLMQLILEK